MVLLVTSSGVFDNGSRSLTDAFENTSDDDGDDDEDDEDEDVVDEDEDDLDDA